MVLSGGVTIVFNTGKSESRNATGLPEILCRAEKGNTTEQVGRAELGGNPPVS